MRKNIGRNAQCHCGSGKKYKNCCLKNEVRISSVFSDPEWIKLRETEGDLTKGIYEFAEHMYGEEGIDKAWNQFNCKEEVSQDDPNFEYFFVNWLLYKYVAFDDEETGDAEEEEEEDFPIAVYYLVINHEKLSEYERDFIAQALKEPLSFFHIEDVIPNKRLFIRDILLDRRFEIKERKASDLSLKGMTIFGSVLTLEGQSILYGIASQPLPENFHITILNFYEELNEEFGELSTEKLLEWDTDYLLRQFFFDCVEIAARPPTITNTDGELIYSCNLQYQLYCSTEDTFDALACLSAHLEREDIVQDAEYDDRKQMTSIAFHWSKLGYQKQKTLDNTILGHINIDRDKMAIDVNSRERSERIQQLIQDKLGNRVELIKIEEKSQDEIYEEGLEKRSHQVEEHMENVDDHFQDPEAQKHIKELLIRYQQSWLDTELPALNGQTPRDASQTEEGRKKLEALLKYFSRTGQNINENARFDIDFLRKELGL